MLGCEQRAAESTLRPGLPILGTGSVCMRWFFVVQGCRMPSSIPSLFPLSANIALPAVTTTVPGHCCPCWEVGVEKGAWAPGGEPGQRTRLTTQQGGRESASVEQWCSETNALRMPDENVISNEMQVREVFWPTRVQNLWFTGVSIQWAKRSKGLRSVVTSTEHYLSITLFAEDVSGWLMSFSEKVLKDIVKPFVLNIFYN